MEHPVHQFAGSFYAHMALMLCGVVLMICTVPGLSKVRGSFLVWKEGNTMLFRKPLPLRRAALGASGFLFFLFLDIVLIATEARNPLPAYFMCVVALSLPVVFLYTSGPNDIRLDGNNRTYEQTVGFPWKPVTKFGTFSGIKGVSISPQNNVHLVLEKPGAIFRGVTLSSSGTKAAAEALVNELKQAYGFAVLPYSKK